jgi:hypothetical protein
MSASDVLRECAIDTFQVHNPRLRLAKPRFAAVFRDEEVRLATQNQQLWLGSQLTTMIQ